MSLHANSLLSTVSTSQAGTWKPANKADGAGKSLVATAFSAPSAQETDSVDVSPLGKALTGVAAKVFEKLDSKARGTLEGYVKTGMMTAEEVVGGLRAIGKEAVRSRYMNKLWEEDGGPSASASDVNKDSYNKQMKFMDGASNLMKELEDIGAEGGDPSASQTKDSFQSLTDYKDKFTKENGDFATIDRDQSQSYIAKSVNDLRESTLFSGEGDGDFFSKSDSASLNKLIDLGFDSRTYATAAKAAVSEIDLSGVQRTSSANAAAATANAAPSTQAKQASTPQADAGWAGLAGSAVKTPENDAMLALLKANAGNTLDRQGGSGVQKGPSVTDTNGNEAVLTALTQALKNGGASAGNGDGTGRTDTIV